MTEKLKLAENEFKLKKYKTALELYSELVGVEYNQIHIKQQIGICLIELGEYQKSIVTNHELIQMSDINPIGYLNIAVALYRQGNSMAALLFLDNALKSDVKFSEKDRKELKSLEMELTGRLIFGEPKEQSEEDYEEDYDDEFNNK